MQPQIVCIDTVGGLGNTLFQVAACLQASLSTGRIAACIEKLASPRAIGTRNVYWETMFSFLRRVHPVNSLKQGLKDLVVYQDRDDDKDIEHYEPIPISALLRQGKNVKLRGYYRHKNHFWEHRSQIVHQFFNNAPLQRKAVAALGKRNSNQFRSHESPKDLGKLDSPESTLERAFGLGNLDPTSYAFVHFRRGDYKQLQQYHPVLKMKYYQNAIRRFPKDVRFLVFCEEEDRNAIAMELNAFSDLKSRFIVQDMKGIAEEVQLTMMGLCRRGGIIANSTFSCWGAYFQQTHSPLGPFVYPKRMFAHTNLAPKIFDPTWWCEEDC